MDSCECKRQISNSTEFLTPLQNDRNKSVCLRITLTSDNNSVEYVDCFWYGDELFLIILPSIEP